MAAADQQNEQNDADYPSDFHEHLQFGVYRSTPNRKTRNPPARPAAGRPRQEGGRCNGTYPRAQRRGAMIMALPGPALRCTTI